MAKCFVRGTPDEVKAVLPSDTKLLVHPGAFYREGQRFTMVSCVPAEDADPEHPDPQCGPRLLSMFGELLVVPFRAFVADEMAAVPAPF